MLTNCPECKGEVSDKASACPRCGHPIALPEPALPTPEAQPQRSKRGVTLVVALLVTVIALLASLVVPGWLKSASRARLESSPSSYIHAGRVYTHDKGIINTYTRATSVEFRNSSEFDVTDISGKITYVASSGAEMAVVPFKASGELQAGATTMLSVSAGEISGGAAKVNVHVEHVRVRQ